MAFAPSFDLSSHVGSTTGRSVEATILEDFLAVVAADFPKVAQQHLALGQADSTQVHLGSDALKERQKLQRCERAFRKIGVLQLVAVLPLEKRLAKFRKKLSRRGIFAKKNPRNETFETFPQNFREVPPWRDFDIPKTESFKSFNFASKLRAS